MKKILLYIALSILTLCTAANAAAAPASISAKLDSATLLMGRTTMLQLSVEVDKNTKGHLPLFEASKVEGIIPVCNDSVELRHPVKIDTVDAGRAWRINYQIPVQSFDSGYYELPQFEYVAGADTSRSNNVYLRVYPVNAKESDPNAPYAGVADPENPSIFDSIPDFIYYNWWILLIAAALIAAGIYIWIRYRKVGHILPPKPEPSPYEVASKALAELKTKKLWENGMEKEYFTELTEILRVYLYKRFGINAMEMTSREILNSLKSNKDTQDKRAYFRQILSMADFVKFAKVRPLPADNIEAYDNAVKFVEETKPVVTATPEDGKQEAKPTAAPSSKNGKQEAKPMVAPSSNTGKEVKS